PPGNPATADRAHAPAPRYRRHPPACRPPIGPCGRRRPPGRAAGTTLAAAAPLPHPPDTQQLADTPAGDLARPAAFGAGAVVRRPGSTEMLLRSVALVEDSRGGDEGEERTDSTAQLQRLEARLDLTLVLLGRLLQQSTPALPPCPLRWSRRGLRLDSSHGFAVAADTHGVIRLQPAEW